DELPQPVCLCHCRCRSCSRVLVGGVGPPLLSTAVHRQKRASATTGGCTMKGEKILVTGPAGQIAFPVCAHLARDNEVWGIARFGDPESRKRVEALGVATRVVDLGTGEFGDLPDDFTYVLHLATFQGQSLDYDYALRTNAEGTGLLLHHCRKAKAALVMST